MNIKNLLQAELKYQQRQLKLIPSENYVSPAVMGAVGSVLMNKYAEGQAGKRYYQGNRNIDDVENLCKKRALDLFKLSENDWSVNVQAVLGSIANLAVYNALLKPKDAILSMSLPDGGHLSHGWQLPDGRKVSFSSKVFNAKYYNIDPNTKRFDMDEIEKLAHEVKPNMIISGGTAYPRTIDFERLGKIAHEVGAYYLADIAHEAGLIAAGVYPSPFEHADVVTMTTRKTLRGPIGSLIFSRAEHGEEIDRSVFPGLQGGPMMNSIAGIAVALEEAATPEFKEYAQQVLKNASTLAKELSTKGFDVVSGGTDKHLILIDIRNKQPDGLIAAEMLEATDIITNKNTIPLEPQERENAPPWRPYGIRLGTPAVTTRGMKEDEMKTIADLMDETLNLTVFEPGTKKTEIREKLAGMAQTDKIKAKVNKLTSRFPIYEDLAA